MKHKKLILSVVLLLGYGLTVLHAQKAVLSNGSVATGPGGTLCYSVGQIAYTTNTGTNGSLTQGVQQPFEIFVGIQDAKGIALSCSVYPNPTNNTLTLKVGNLNHSTLTIFLYDMSGTLLENKKLTGNETSIDMSQLVAATYFLKIIEDDKEVSTFKIIKN